VDNDSAEVTLSGRSFHFRGPTTGKARLVGDGCQLDQITLILVAVIKNLVQLFVTSGTCCLQGELSITSRRVASSFHRRTSTTSGPTLLTRPRNHELLATRYGQALWGRGHRPPRMSRVLPPPLRTGSPMPRNANASDFGFKTNRWLDSTVEMLSVVSMLSQSRERTSQFIVVR